MTLQDTGYLAFYVVVLIALAKPLGLYMTAVYEGRRTWLHPVLRPVEHGIYRAAGIKEEEGAGLEALPAGAARLQPRRLPPALPHPAHAEAGCR